MRRSLTILPLVLVALSICAFGQILDPNVGVFDPNAACAPTCGTHPNSIPLTEFGVWNYGNAGAPLPWYIIFAVPDNTGGAPPLSSDASSPDSFVASGPTDVGAYLSSSSLTEYEFAASATTMTADEINAADNSMNTTNMFGAAELAAFGSTPSSFEIYVYSLSPALPSQVKELFDTSIVAGTFVSVLGVDRSGNNPQVFATPFTTAGLGASTTTTTTTTVGETASAGSTGVPEPSGIVLLGSALLAACAGLRKRRLTRVSQTFSD